MNAVLKIIISVIFLLGSGAFENRACHFIKSESLLKVHRGLSPLSAFSQKLTR